MKVITNLFVPKNISRNTVLQSYRTVLVKDQSIPVGGEGAHARGVGEALAT
jgi:hypothetical protein